MRQDLKRHADPAQAACGGHRIKKRSDLDERSINVGNLLIPKFFMTSGTASPTLPAVKTSSPDPGVHRRQTLDLENGRVKFITEELFTMPVKTRELDPETEPSHQWEDSI